LTNDTLPPGAHLAWLVARNHNQERRTDQRMIWWNLSGAALTIWLTRNWTTDQLVAKAHEIIRSSQPASSQRFEPRGAAVPVAESSLVRSSRPKRSVGSRNVPHSCGMLQFHPARAAMSTPLEDLASEALKLPAEDRAKLVERLIASFEPKSPAQAEWLRLATARREEGRSGQVNMVPGDEALARVRARLA